MPKLPALRDDLQLFRGGSNEQGEPTWLIYDGHRHKYFRISKDAFHALSAWRPGLDSGRWLRELKGLGHGFGADDLSGLLNFLISNQLIQVTPGSGSDWLAQQEEKARQHWFMWLLHHYLFIRVPLWRPDGFLRATMPAIAPLFSPRVRWTIRGAGCLGVLMALQQWDAFVATFMYFFSWDGMVYYLLALAAVKSAHELGHAYVATRYGCRVSSIGVAFLVMFPVLYTDTTDAWRLRSRRQRLSIVTAGVMVELHIAMLATLAWSFLPDGGLRSAMFFIATTSWVTSLLVNISPFMRFDGYFAFADVLGADNLQNRAFALAKWRLREWLFGLQEAPPEVLQKHRARLFIVYAFATWVYRFFLFLGIALLVYHFAFKLLGIVLFVVELIWFIAMPIYKEIAVWFAERERIAGSGRARVLLFTVTGLFALGLTPVATDVTVPAIMQASTHRQVYVPLDGVVTAINVQQGQKVQEGEVLVQLHNDELQATVSALQLNLQLKRQLLERAGASAQALDNRLVLQGQFRQLQSQLEQALQQSAGLAVVAPVAGTVTFLDHLHVGLPIPANHHVLSLTGHGPPVTVALVGEDQVSHIDIGASARWYSSIDTDKPIDLVATNIAHSSVAALPFPALASTWGGPIAVRQSASQQLIPEQAFYRVELQPIQDQIGSAPTRETAGSVVIEGRPRSYLSRYLNKIAQVLIRESGV